ncbi:rapid alkalinization factor-like [Aristolochia californica]|uniref:rapid alkalinization factor-like n=1 Tax=Aristolochia californica TaxID=171875 RepID=UPI0035D660A1
MASSSTTVFIVFVLILALFISSSTVQAGEHEFGWMPSRSSCNGNLGDCLEEDEFDMDSEISRRILATSQYISYEALKKNSVPCSRRGASYYNCRSGAQANPYNRGCSAITRCRS